MFKKMLFSFACASVALSASEKTESVHALSFENIQAGKRIEANQVQKSVQGGTSCQHVGQYEHGKVVTQIGGLKAGVTSLTLNVAGEQTLSMDDGFTSVSKDWEIRGSYVVHHHDGFDVHTSKKKQFVVSK